MSTLVRTILACESTQLAAPRIMLAYAALPGLDDVGEVDNLTPESQEVTLTVNAVTTTYKVVELRVPADTAAELERMFDPLPEDRAALNDRIDAARLKIATVRAIRAKAPADRTDEERSQLREARKDLPGQLPTLAAFRQGARACRFWIIGADERRNMRRFFDAPARVEQGWQWVERVQSPVVA